MQKMNYALVGYSIESAILARKIALSGQKIIFIKSGKLGYPFDDVREYLSIEDINKINEFSINFPVRKMCNSTYVFIPYEQLKFINTKNGLISFPLNKSSFESAEEWEQIEECINLLPKFKKDLKKATNFVNIYKNFFPKWLYDSLLRYIGINKWGNFRQSKLTREALAREIDVSYLNRFGTCTIYRPVITYEELCELILSHENIEIKEMSMEDLKSFIVTRHRNLEIALMDNRVDYLCNYTHGAFDRVKFECKKLVNSNMEEFIDINEGIVLTPTKDYFCVSNEEGNIIKITSKKVETMNFCEQSSISPTSYNRKLYNEYKKLLYLYSRKTLNLSSNLKNIII